MADDDHRGADEAPKVMSQLRAAVHRYQFMALALIVGGLGIWLILRPERYPSPDVARDLGVALLAAGTISLALEFFTRRQFQDLVRDDLRKAVDSSDLSVKLDDMLALVSLGGDLRELGVRRIHRDRNAIDFSTLIEEADPETEVRFLGVCLSGFVDRPSQVLLQKKDARRLQGSLSDTRSRIQLRTPASLGGESYVRGHQAGHRERR
ncbi:MAG: hypothetical protein ACQGVK_18280 [Myxococcota bacterium]